MYLVQVEVHAQLLCLMSSDVMQPDGNSAPTTAACSPARSKTLTPHQHCAPPPAPASTTSAFRIQRINRTLPPPPPPPPPQHHRPHRLEHLRHPENTMPAFEEAVPGRGADYIEVDVRTTSDGKLVLSHDANVSRCTNGTGEVAKMTFEEIRALDAGIKKGPEFAGTKVPRFDEVLDYARGKDQDLRGREQGDCQGPGAAHRRSRHGRPCSDLLPGGSPKRSSSSIPNLKIMPESVSVEMVQRIVTELHPKVIAFGGSDWKPEIIKLAKDSGAGTTWTGRAGQPTIRGKSGKRRSMPEPTESRRTVLVNW